MRDKFFGLLLLAVLFFLTPLHLSNAYLRCTQFEDITVKVNENVHSIAQRYTSDEKQLLALQEAIIEINSLRGDGHLRPGQSLHIPIKTKEHTLFALAER